MAAVEARTVTYSARLRAARTAAVGSGATLAAAGNIAIGALSTDQVAAAESTMRPV